MAVIGNAPFQGLVSGGEILDASIEGVDLSTSAIAARLGYTPVNPAAAAITGGTITGLSSPLPVASGGTGVATSTGSGNIVLSTSPTLVTPALGTPSALVGTNITGTATAFTASNVTTNANLTGVVTSVGNATSLGSFTSAQLATALTDETGSGANVFATSPTLVTPVLGVATATSLQGIIGNVTPAAGTFTTVTASSNISADNAFLGGNLTLPLTGKLNFNGSTATDYMVGPSSGTIDSYIASTLKTRLTSTGLQITGTLSATGNLTSLTAQFGTNPAGVSIGVIGIPNQKRIYGRNTANTADINILYVSGNDTVVFGPSDVATFSTSGLAVDGTLSVGPGSGAGGIAVGSAAGRAQYQYVNFGGSVGGTDYAWQIGRSPSGGVGPADGFYFYDIKSNATRLVIDLSGNVGINNTSPAVLGNTTQVAIKANVSADAMFVAQNSNGLTTAKFGFQFTGSVDSPVIGSYSNHPFLFLTNNSERMRIHNDGGLSIGTAASRAKLHIDVGAVAGTVELVNLHNQSTTSGNGSSLTFSGYLSPGNYPTWRYAGIKGVYDTTSPGVGASGWGGKLSFFVNRGTTADGFEDVMTLTAGANVGIGRDNPFYKLDVYDSVNGATTMRLLNTFGLVTSNAYGYSRFQGLSGGNGLFLSQNVNGINGGSSVLDDSARAGYAISMGENYSGWAFLKYAAGAGTVTPSLAMFLNSSGNLGIGVPNPTHTLHVSQGLRMAAFGGDLYSIDGALSYYGATNGVYLNGPGANGWLRLNAGGGENDVNSINIFGSANARIEFRTANTERMRITAGGAVGIGLGGGDPEAKLHVKMVRSSSTSGIVLLLADNVTGGQTNNVYKAIRSASNSGASQSEIRFVETDGTNNNTAIAFATAHTAGGLSEKARVGPDGQLMVGTMVGNAGSGGIHATGSILQGGAGLYQQQLSITGGNAIQSYVLGVGYTDLRLNPLGGNVQINTTSTVDGNGAALVINCAYPKTRMEIRNDGEANGLYAITFRNVNGLVGNITTQGSSTSFNTSSDYRLKNTITPMTNALAKVALLKPVTYKWNADGSDGEGFIAHELAEVCPQAVFGEKDALEANGSIKPQGIDTSFLVATLTAAIQEQQAMILVLQQEVAILKGGNA